MIYLVLLAAPRGAGKTTACERFVEQGRQAGMRIGGILAPARYDSPERKTGIFAVDAFTEERRLLATVEREPGKATVGQYRFDSDVMEWSLGRVLLALDAPIDVVVIDEIGPLELVQKGGFAPALERLSQAQATTAVLIVRAELLTRLQAELAAYDPATISLTRTNRDQVPMYILKQVWGPVSQRWQDA